MADYTNTTTAIDLSRLPAPTVVEQLSYENILAELIAQLQLLFPEFDATIESDPGFKQLEVIAYRELLLRQQFNERARQLMLAYATGANLDQLGANFNVARILITPADPAAGIEAEYESDSDFRRRIQLSPESLSVAGPASAYEFWALSADATIVGANASSPEPGQVQVALLTRYGDGTASAEQIEAVELALGKSVRPLTDQVIVVSAEIVPYQIEAELILFDGPDASVVLTAAQAGAENFVANARRLGRDINRANLLAAITVEGVANVNLVSPALDLAIAPNQCANCVGVTISVAGRGS